MSRHHRTVDPPQELPEPIYLDASALVKLLMPEPESDPLNQALLGARDVVISDLALTEVASALARRTREGRLSTDEAKRLQRAGERVASGLRRVETTPVAHRHAERLLLIGSDTPLRTLDALHVALALSVDAATFVTYDTRLSVAAASQGLLVAAPPPRR